MSRGWWRWGNSGKWQEGLSQDTRCVQAGAAWQHSDPGLYSKTRIIRSLQGWYIISVWVIPIICIECDFPWWLGAKTVDDIYRVAPHLVDPASAQCATFTMSTKGSLQSDESPCTGQAPFSDFQVKKQVYQCARATSYFKSFDSFARLDSVYGTREY